jgi:hypothetical protein
VQEELSSILSNQANEILQAQEQTEVALKAEFDSARVKIEEKHHQKVSGLEL